MKTLLIVTILWGSSPPAVVPIEMDSWKGCVEAARLYSACFDNHYLLGRDMRTVTGYVSLTQPGPDVRFACVTTDGSVTLDDSFVWNRPGHINANKRESEE